jgi:permease
MRKGLKTVIGAVAMMALLAGCVPSAKQETTSAGSSAAQTQTASKDMKKIGVVQLMEHTSLNIINDAMMKELKELGYEDGVNCKIDYKNAQGDMSNITSIIQNFAGNKQDVLVTIATPVAQGAMELAKTTPVVFSAVTDPIGAGVLTNMDAPDKGMTGTSDAVQIDKIMELAMKISPQAKKFGYIYNPGEDNSVHNLKLLEDFAKQNGLTIETASISTSAELQTAASTLFPKVDAIFVANDNTVASAMPVLAQESVKAKKPVYVGADSMVMDGGFATVGIDYEDLGKETAKMVDEVLKGKNVKDIPVKVFKDDLFTYVNADTAKALGITIPDEIKNSPKYKELTTKKQQ